MANVAHASLTGAELHEPKGADAALSGQVYVANGSGSGSWSTISTSAFTGMIADFAAPVAPSGWLELNGDLISTTTYASLYAVMTIQSSGSRTNGSAVITSMPSTSNFKVGYYVFGVGIVSGSTIVSIDSATQITISNNATSSGTATVAVSPWLMNTGTIQLPDVTTAGRYRRSRTASTKVGDLLADQNQAHTHTGSGTSSTESADHTHTFSGTTSGQSQSHTHSQTNASLTGGISYDTGTTNTPIVGGSGGSTGAASQDHTHTYSGTTSGKSATHTHTYSFTSSSNGGTEARPTTMVVLTCVKT